jgi:DNA repair protein RadC
MAPREVFRDALLRGASALFLAHNHPSGDASPSADDRAVTRRLAQAGALLGIDLLDHLVVGDPDWTSLARLGVI